jgi:hypothetical protein
MMGQQTVFMGLVYYPGRSCHMPHRERSFKAIFMTTNKRLEGRNDIAFFWIASAVAID